MSRISASRSRGRRHPHEQDVARVARDRVARLDLGQMLEQLGRVVGLRRVERRDLDEGRERLADGLGIEQRAVPDDDPARLESAQPGLHGRDREPDEPSRPAASVARASSDTRGRSSRRSDRPGVSARGSASCVATDMPESISTAGIGIVLRWIVHGIPPVEWLVRIRRSLRILADRRFPCPSARPHPVRTRPSSANPRSSRTPRRGCA